MLRLMTALGMAGILLSAQAPAADLPQPVKTGRFRATCEDLGKLCFADACGRDQIDAALGCRARCPSSAIMSVVPDRCPLLPDSDEVVLKRKG